MTSNAQAIINVLPVVSGATQIFFTVIDPSDNSFNEGTITNTEIIYGNINLTANNIFIPYDNKPIALKVFATYSGNDYVSILYTKAVYGNILPDNFLRLTQKTPSGIYDSFVSDIDQDGNEQNVIVIIYKAIAKMLDDYYSSLALDISLFYAINQVYSTQYSAALEYEYNGTIGLLNSSVYVPQLFQLLARLDVVYLNTYDLELFVSQYIYYRLGTISAVYIDDHVSPPAGYWILNDNTLSVLGTTTILAPDSYQPILKNLKWHIYNAAAFTGSFKKELRDLIIRISRADIGNSVHTSPIVDPVDDDFTLVGASYPLDPRTLYNKCIQYIGDDAYPLNVIAYVKNI